MPPIPAGLVPTTFLPLLQETIEAGSDRLLAEALAIDPALRNTIRREPAPAASRT